MSLEDFVDQLIAEKTKSTATSVVGLTAGKQAAADASEGAQAGDSLCQILDKLAANHAADEPLPAPGPAVAPHIVPDATASARAGAAPGAPSADMSAQLRALEEQLRSRDEQLQAQNEQMTALTDKMRLLIDSGAAPAHAGNESIAAVPANFPWKRHLASVQEYLKNKDTVTSEATLNILVDAADAIPVESPVRVRLMTQLATIRLEHKEYPKAEETLHQALSVIDGANQRQTIATAFCLDALAQCRQEQDDFDEAERLRREAVVIADECLGAEHPDASYFRERLDTLRQERAIATIGNDEGSRTVLDKLTDEYNAAIAAGQPGGPLADNTAPDMVAGLMFEKYIANGKTALLQKNMREAESALRSAMEKAEKLPNSDPRKCEGFRLLASALEMQGKDHEAKQLYESCLTVAFRYIGWNDSNVARCLSALADIHSRLNDFGLAKNYYKQALAAMKTLLGNDHETVKGLDEKYQEFLARVKEERRWKGWSA